MEYKTPETNQSFSTVPVVISTADGKHIKGVYAPGSRQPDSPIAFVIPRHLQARNSLFDWSTCALFYSFAAKGFSVLRIQSSTFSSTEFPKNDKQFTELLYIKRAFQWLFDRHPDAVQIWVAGVSFGAYMAMQLLMRRINASGFVVISPPVAHYDFSFLSPCPTQGLIIHGHNDPNAPEEEINELVMRIRQQEVPLETSKISGFSTPQEKSQLIDSITRYLGEYYWTEGQ